MVWGSQQCSIWAHHPISPFWEARSGYQGPLVKSDTATYTKCLLPYNFCVSQLQSLGQWCWAGVSCPQQQNGTWRLILKAALGLDIIKNLLQLLIFKPPLQATRRKPKELSVSATDNVPDLFLTHWSLSTAVPTSPFQLYFLHAIPFRNTMKYFKDLKKYRK